MKKHNALKRLLNFFLIRLQLAVRSAHVLGYPYFLVVEPTNICNLKCPLCPTGQGVEGRAKGNLSFDNFKKIIKEMGGCLFSLRLENWGEPLLNKEILKMISYAKSEKISTSFNSNLCFLDEESAEKLILSGLDRIKISLDGASKESYLKYRVGGDFNKVINNIKLLAGIRSRLKRRNPFIEIQFIVMRHNEGEIALVKQLSAELGADRLSLERVRPDMREELFNSTALSIDKFKDWLPENSEYAAYNYRGRMYAADACNYLWTTVVVNWDGSIAPCCSVYDPKYDFGNIFKDGFRKVWNGPKYIASRKLIGHARKSIESTVCINCFKYGVVR